MGVLRGTQEWMEGFNEDKPFREWFGTQLGKQGVSEAQLPFLLV